MGFLTSLIAFIVAIGILVAIHEFGHYWVARKMGVKVLRFSVGFGAPLWRKVAGADQTEYVIGAIPLGGYVKMLDEREGEVPEAERDRAFNRQSVGKRIAIVAAGPVFNFLFAIAAYMLMFMVGVTGLKPEIGEVLPESPAAHAGIETGWTIAAVDGKQTPTWENAALAIINKAMDKGVVTLTLVDDDGATLSRTLDLADSRELFADGEILENIGIRPWRPQVPAVLGRLVEGGPGASAGLQAGDRVIGIAGKPVAVWQDLVAAVRSRPGERVEFEVERDGSRLAFAVQLEAVDEGKLSIGRVGAIPQVDEKLLAAHRVEVRYNPLTAFIQGVKRTWDMSILTLRFMGKMLTGQASLDNVSGPITIAQYAGVSALIGVSAFLGFLGIVSVSLGVLNLLPIPVLDGGHLLFYLIEAVKGSPLSETAEAIGQRIGLGLLAMLMGLAFFNDFNRLFG